MGATVHGDSPSTGIGEPSNSSQAPQIIRSFSIICVMTSPLSALENWEAVYPDVDVALTRPISRTVRAGRLVEQAMHRVVRDHGLSTLLDYEVLAYLRRGDPESPPNVSTVGGALGVPKAAMTGRLDRLEQAGLVRRAADPTDRRALTLHLTDLGQQVTDEVFRDHVVVRDELMADFSREEAEQLAALLGKLLDSNG